MKTTKYDALLIFIPVLLALYACQTRWVPTEDEIHACRDAKGDWRCPGPPLEVVPKAAPVDAAAPLKATAALTQPPALQPNWGVPLLVVDKHNRSGCARDSNTCTSTTCGGVGSPVGPCATKAQISSRWGCPTWLCRDVRITTAVVLDLMSEDTDLSDPWGFQGTIEPSLGGSLVIKAESPAPLASGSTTSCLQQSVINTTPEELTSAAFAGAVAGNLITVTTTGPLTTRQWAMFHSVNTVFTTTSMALTTLPLLSFTPTVATCQTGGGDTVAVSAPYAENIVDLHPRVGDYTFEGGIIPQQPLVLTNMTVLSLGGVGTSTISIGHNVSATEVAFQKAVEFDESNGDTVPEGFVNVLFEGGWSGGRLSSGAPLIFSGGGALQGAGLRWNLTGQGNVIDGSFWASTSMSFPQGVQIASLIAASPNFLSPVTLTLGSTSYFMLSTAGYANNGCAGTPPCTGLMVWGINTSVINATGNARYDSASGLLGAGWTGINAGANAGSALSLNLNGLSTGCSFAAGLVGGSPMPWYCVINITNTSVDSATSTSAFGGHVYANAGGAGAQFQGNLQ